MRGGAMVTNRCGCAGGSITRGNAISSFQCRTYNRFSYSMPTELPASAEDVASDCNMVTKNAKLPTDTAPDVTSGSTCHAIANTTTPSSSGAPTQIRTY